MEYACSTGVTFVGKFPLDLFGEEEKDQKGATGYKREGSCFGSGSWMVLEPRGQMTFSGLLHVFLWKNGLESLQISHLQELEGKIR